MEFKYSLYLVFKYIKNGLSQNVLTSSGPETYLVTFWQTSPLPQIYRGRIMVRRVAISNVIIPFHINMRCITNLLKLYLGQASHLGYQVMPSAAAASFIHKLIWAKAGILIVITAILYHGWRRSSKREGEGANYFPCRTYNGIIECIY